MQSLSQEQLKALIASAQALKEKGSTEANDPEFAQRIAILRQYSSIGKSLTQQQPPRPSQPSTVSTQWPTLPATGTMPQQPTTTPSQVPASAAQPSAATGPFTPEQLTALRCQIYVFKLISSNKPVPEHLRQKVFDSEISRESKTPVSVTAESPQIPQKIVESAYKQQQIQQNQQPKPASVKATSARFEPGPLSNPQALLPKKIASAELQNRILIPSGTPSGVDAYSLIQERERQIQSRIQYRIRELENLPSNLSNDTGSKLRAMIELKSLKLLEKQKRLRLEIVHALSRGTTLATATDRSSFRRMKKQSLREARQTEKLEKNQRLEREKRERQKHQEFLLSVLNHGRELLNFHKQQQNKSSRLGQAVARFHATAQKEEEKRQQRISQERLNALKANDEAAYLRLVDKAKDNRIMHLLNQTESYLNSLTKAMHDQKASVEYETAEEETHPGEDHPGEKDYYSTAHKISETVTQQPNLLVGGKLKEYQIKGLQWMVSLYNNRLNGILADEMGLGKTIQTISLITYLMEKKKQNGPFLVIVPLSTITNWDLEFERWAPSVNRIVFKGTAPERARLRNDIKAGHFNVLITTYEYVIREKSLLSKIKWVYMIIDEGHRMKNTNSKLSTTLMQYYSTRYRLILTGTPLQNNLPELWALLNFILPKIFNSVETFDEWFNHPFAKEGGKDTDMKLNEEESLLIIRGLHKVLRPFLLRRLKKDVEAELPDKVETVVKCPMSALQSRLYEQIRSKKSSFGGDGVTRRKALNNLVMQFRKVCNHPYVFEDVEHVMNPTRATDDNLWRVAGKFELLDRILPKFKASDHRVLMFFQMTQVMDIMEDYLRLTGFKYLRLDGHTKAEDRTTMLKKFNSTEDPPFIFLLSTRAGGLGLNLQTADTVVIFDSDWNPHQDLQAQDRAHRIGQTREVRILRLITARSVEETILARAQYKLDIDGKVIQAGKFDNKTTDRERDELLRSLFGGDEDDEEKEENEGYLEDSELNEIIARTEEELALFAKMDEERRTKELQMWRAAGKKGTPPPRLMQDDELPSMYLDDDSSMAVEEEVEFGRGARARKEVRYDDGLNDDQFLAALDTGDVEGYIERRRAQQAKREERKKGKVSLEEQEEDMVKDEEDHPPAGKTPGRKRGRPPKKAKTVNEYLDEDTGEMGEELQSRKRIKKARGKDEIDEPFGPKRGRKRKVAGVDPNEVDSVPPALRKAFRRVFESAYKAVEEAQVVYEDGSYRMRCELFRELPARAHYPDYYRLIKSPIALDMIWHRLTHVYYKTLDEFVADFHLMFANAMTYNIEGSVVYDDAVEMKKIFDARIEELAPGGDVTISQDDERDAALEAERESRRLSLASGLSDDELETPKLDPTRNQQRFAMSDDEEGLKSKARKKMRGLSVPGLSNKYASLPKIRMKIPETQNPEKSGDMEDGEITE